MGHRDELLPGPRTLPALDRVLAAARPRHTGPEAAALAGVDPAWAATVWRAAGFDADFAERELSDEDARILAAAADLVRSGRIAEAELFQLARMFNLAAAPLAEAAAASVFRDAAVDDARLVDLETSLATFETVVLHSWRRRLLRVLASDRSAERCDEGVGFADLAGFTAMVRRDDGRWLAALDRLESVAFDVVAGHGGRVVKTIGDEVMFVHREPAGTVAICRTLAATAADDELLPPLRIGAAWGETVATRGDRFGAPVNLASRLVRRCRTGEALVCDRLAAHAPDTRRARARWLKGTGFVRAARLVPERLG